MWRLVILVPALGLVVGGLTYQLAGGDLGSLWPARREPADATPTIDVLAFDRTQAGEPICPHCGKTREVREYLYGLVREDFPEGRVPGGCAVGPHSPRYKCLGCGTCFGKIDLPEPGE